MKKVIYCVIAAVLLVSLLLGCAPPAPTGPVELSAVAWLGLGRSLSKSVETTYVDMVQERSNGELIINFLGGPEVVPKPEQAQACSDGVVDMTFTVAGEYRQVIPEVAGIHLSPTTPWEDRTNGIYDYWLDLHKKYNLYYVMRWNYNMDYVLHLGEKRAESLADFKGLKIAPLGRLDPLVEALGGVNVEVGGREIYTGMERGLIDGYIWSDSGRFGGWEEVTKYIVDHPLLSAATFALVMNLDKFNALPKHLQKVLIEVSAEYEPIMADYFAELRNTERQKMIDAGVEYIKLPPDEGKWLTETGADFAWEMVKGTVSPESYAKLRKVLLLQ